MGEETLGERRRAMVSRGFEALNERDHGAFRELIPADMEFRSVAGAMEGRGVMVGPEEFLDFYESMRSTWDDLRWEIEEIRDADERTAIAYRITGVARRSGIPLEQPLGQVWTWRRGEAVPARVQIYMDPREAFAAVARD